MKLPDLAPRVHLFVCANRRNEDDPLGSGCGDRGERVFSALKRAVAQAGVVRSVWVTKTHCLGLCPKRGCTVANHPAGEIFTEVEDGDLDVLFERTRRTLEREDPSSEDPSPGEGLTFEEMEKLLSQIEDGQRAKVVRLAARLRPGLTSEDLQNPHDFPELDDTDWHYEDGMLTGIQAVRAAVRARRRETGEREPT